MHPRDNSSPAECGGLPDGGLSGVPLAHRTYSLASLEPPSASARLFTCALPQDVPAVEGVAIAPSRSSHPPTIFSRSHEAEAVIPRPSFRDHPKPKQSSPDQLLSRREIDAHPPDSGSLERLAQGEGGRVFGPFPPRPWSSHPNIPPSLRIYKDFPDPVTAPLRSHTTNARAAR
ncbi:hypothetical protein B2J93_2734 [Marssonina coronariae]|uniref:Uncharacterized protein n=1 Tax=Diplocarpon coronariae TaxID=2795749 RepID=A0A218Z5N3_9HELO|nr:hypothetical protein B2J93_2734 [Marssonina coronariae]